MSEARRRHQRIPAWLDGWLVAWVGALTAVVIGPMAAKGWVLALDWVTGPRLSLRDHIFAGSSLPAGPLFWAAASVLHGIGGAAVGWLVPAVSLFVAGIGGSRLGGPTRIGRMAAATAYLWNPFVHERLYAGQVALLAGYALLPFLARASASEMRIAML